MNSPVYGLSINGRNLDAVFNLAGTRLYSLVAYLGFLFGF